MRSPRLPMELCDILIDNCYTFPNDTVTQSTLRACSLTCKAFLPRTRYHLFSQVNLTSSDGANSFLDIISSANSSIPCTYVRRLVIGIFYWKGHFEAPWVNKALVILAARLTEVTELSVSGIRWRLLDDAEQTTVMLGFQKVKYLNICGTFRTSGQINSFIASFPSLTDISCPRIYWGLPDNATVMIRSPLPRSLTTIALRSSLAHLFAQFMSLDSHPIVRTVIFEYNAEHLQAHVQNMNEL